MNVNEQAYGSKDLWYSIPYGTTQFPASTTIEERNTLANFTDTIPSSIDWHLWLGRVIYEVEVNNNQTFKDLFYNTVFDKSICFVGQSGKSSYTSIRFFDNQGTDSNNPNVKELPTQTYDVVNLAFSNGLGDMRDYGNNTRSWNVIGADIDRDPSGNSLKFDAIRWNPLGWPGIKGTDYYHTKYGNRYEITFITNMGVKRNVLVPYVKAGPTDTSDTNAIGTYDLATYLSTYKDAKPYVYSIGFETTVMYGESIEASSSNQRTVDYSYGLMLMEYISSLNDFYYIGPNNEWQTAHYNNDLFVPQILKSPHMPLGGYINNGSYSGEAPSTLGYENTLNSVGVHAVIDCNDIKWDTWVNVGNSTAEGTCNKILVADARKYTEDEFREAVRHSLACFGMFFADSETVAQQGKLDDPNMFLGTIVNGIGYGDYTSGKDNRNQPQWNWDSMSENDYDPQNPPIEPETDPLGTPILPSDPGFTTAGKGTACYAMTYLDIDEMMEDIFGSTTAKYNELVEGLAMFGSNPMNAFVSCKWYPFVFSSPRNSPVILGSTIVNNNHQYNIIDGTDVSFKKFTGSVKIKADKNFVWSRRTKARLFLPFYGFYELPMNMLMSYTCQVEFHYNVPDEMATWIISFGDVIYDFVECDPSIEVPLTGDNAREIMLTKRQIAAQNAIKDLAIVTLLATAGVQSVIAGEIAGSVGAGVVTAGDGIGSAIARGVKAGLGGFFPPYLKTTAATVAGVGVADNNIINLSRTLGNLSVNVPTHGGSGATTFLNFPLEPYIQLYQPAVLSDYNESEYKLKVGIACDKWCKISEMPENSLLKATGIADNSTSGMELSEIKELNAILQSGFYR